MQRSIHWTFTRRCAPLIIASLVASLAAAQAESPLQTLKDALNKAIQSKQSQQQAPAQQTTSPTGSSAAPASQPAPTQVASAGTAAPWTPPADPASTPVGPLVPSKLPDVDGIHVAVPREEVSGLIKKLYPAAVIQIEGRGEPLTGVYSGNVLKAIPKNVGAYGPPGETIYAEYTMPPNKQLAYLVYRDIKFSEPIDRQNFLDALHQKYGKETSYAPAVNGGMLWWLFDEQGRPVPAGKSPNGSPPYGCDTGGPPNGNAFLNKVNDYLNNRLPAPTFCDSVVLLKVGYGGTATTVQTSYSYLVDGALWRREAIVTGDAQKAQAQQQKQQEVQKANQAKPNL
jgi:hypothetical protein